MKVSMETNTNQDRLDEMKLYQKVLKTILSEIDELKTKLQMIESVTANLQELFFSGHMAENDKLLADDLMDDSVINKDQNIAPIIKIYVEIPKFPNAITLDVKNSDTIQCIKSMIHDIQGIAPEQQTPVFDGKVLEDTYTLSACNITANSTLHMVLKEDDKLKVKISFSEGEVEIFYIRTWFTIWDVKTLIKSKRQIPQHKQVLFYKGEELDDMVTPFRNIINSDSILHLKIQMHIFIESIPGVSLICEVYRCDEVRKLQEVIEEKLGIRIAEQLLSCNGVRIAGAGTLGDRNIQDGDRIYATGLTRGN